MAKEVKFSDSARQSMLAGVNTLSDAAVTSVVVKVVVNTVFTVVP